MREIITLQFGSYANHIGAHFWNTQDELFGRFNASQSGSPEFDIDILHRDVRDYQSSTYVPRVLIFDHRDSTALHRARLGWSEPSQVVLQAANGSREVTRLPGRQLPANPFLDYLSGEGDRVADPAGFNFDSIVQSWGDFSKARFHPSSLVGVGGRSATGDSLGAADASAVFRSLSDASGSSSSDGGGEAFDAFSLGLGMVNEEMEDLFRRQLESCDALQGVQAVVDIDSGWGGLAAAFLARAVRDELPKAPLLVLGAARPGPRAARASSSAGPGPFGSGSSGTTDYKAIGRDHTRNLNLGLAYAAFGGAHNDLDAQLIPLSSHAYTADLMAARASTDGQLQARARAWFAGLAQPNPSSDYHTSALLATAWDCATLPIRRPLSSSGDATPGGANNSDAYLDDSRMKRSAEAPSASSASRATRRRSPDYDEAIEDYPHPPLVSLSSSCSLGQLLAALAPTPGNRITAVSLRMPFPQPKLSATGLNRLLEGMQHPGRATVDVLAPLSWHSALPGSGYDFYIDDTTGSSASHNPHTSAQQAIGQYAPLAHALVMRGVGTDLREAAPTADAAGGGPGSRMEPQPVSSLEAYGRALDRYIARAGCPSASHAVFRAPFPIAVTFPSHFFDRAAGASVYSALGGVVPDDSPEAVAVPYSVPALAHLSTGPRYQPALKALAAAFAVSRRDATRHRFDLGDPAAAAQRLEDAAAALAQMVDDYAAGHEEDAFS